MFTKSKHHTTSFQEWKYPQIFFKGSKGKEVTGPHTTNQTYGWPWQTAGRLWTTFFIASILCPVISVSLLASNLGQWCEASCHFLATDTWQLFLLSQDTNPDAAVQQMLHRQWWLSEDQSVPPAVHVPHTHGSHNAVFINPFVYFKIVWTMHSRKITL